MAYGQLPYNRASWKGSHNSYQRDEDLLTQLRWVPGDPAHGGCRAVELDITDHSDNSGGRNASYLQVTHDQGGHGPFLSTYLDALMAFHNQTPAHDPIFVTLDIKSAEGRYDTLPVLLETYLATWFRRELIFAPGSMVRNPARTLLDNVQRSGWPTIGSLAGKFVFCLSGTETWKANYAGDHPAQRLCFADFDVADDGPATIPPDGHRVVANLNLFSAHAAHWLATVPVLRRDACLVRGYVLNGENLFAEAKSAGVNVLSTDEITGTRWAHVGSDPFVATGS